MKEWLLRFLDLGTAPGDDPDLVLRKRTGVATILVICVGFLTFTVTRLLADRPALVALTVVCLLGQAGDLPGRALGLVVEWGSVHQGELRADWERARQAESLLPIEPLR